MIADAEAWLNACRGMLTNEGAQPFLYPHFPGINSSGQFQCELNFGEAWGESIRDVEIRSALSTDDYAQRVKKVVGLYVRALEVLARATKDRT